MSDESNANDVELTQTGLPPACHVKTKKVIFCDYLKDLNDRFAKEMGENTTPCVVSEHVEQVVCNARSFGFS